MFSRFNIAGSFSITPPGILLILFFVLFYIYIYTMEFVPQADRCQKVLSQLVTQILPQTFPDMFFE